MTDQSLAARALSRPEFIALVAGLMALNSLAIDVMLPALPAMGQALGVATDNDRQLVISAYMIGFGVAQLAFGPITDRFGRRAPLFAGIILYVLSAFLATFAPSFALLLLLRLFQGFGAAATRVIAMSVIRDRFSGREMASVMSLAFMVFMVLPIVAPGIGQLILFVGTWHEIFLFMAGLATIIGIWVYFRLPETLHPEYRRPLKLAVITEGFRLVFTNRAALFYGLSGMFFFSGMFGFIICTQQIFVGIYGLGTLFPVAFAFVAGLMAISNFVNSRIVKQYGQRRVSHFALLVYIGSAVVMLALALLGPVPFWAYFALLCLLQFVFAWATSNMNSLSMEPLGQVAGTAAAVFGFLQTVGGAVIGTFIGQLFNGTLVPNSAAYVVMGLLVLGCVLIAENGRLFGIGKEYQATPAMAE
ncbi:MAG TPA: multidrug effflux MFS transporter [Devosia sp.]|nr:multidrug effflux MFS transporter [Devosia sp.]